MTDIQMVEATEKHLSELIEIHVAAFQKDKYVKLMYKEDEHRQVVSNLLKNQLSDKKSILAICQENSTATKLGWASYNSFNTTDEVCHTDTGDAERTTEQQATILKATKTDVAAEVDRDKAAKAGKHTTLASAVRIRLQEKIKTHTAGKRCYYINTLAVHPVYQHKGIGKFMVRWIVSKADEAGVDCWVQSSPAARQVYKECGFEEVDHLDVDVKEFGPDFDPGQVKFPAYRFFYMRRKAKGTE